MAADDADDTDQNYQCSAIVRLAADANEFVSERRLATVGRQGVGGEGLRPPSRGHWRAAVLAPLRGGRAPARRNRTCLAGRMVRCLGERARSARLAPRPLRR